MPTVTTPEQLARLMDANYADGLSEIVDGPNVADIARIVFDQDGETPDPQGLNALWVAWGQFVDHDLDLTRDTSEEIIQIPGLAGPFERSVFDETTGITGPRQQVSEITPRMDASQIYGSTEIRLGELRAFEGGRLKMIDDPTTPFGLLETGDNGLFIAGDVRANENTGLTMLHTLFNREHNYWADRLASENPDWTDEQIFQAARSIIEAEFQKITYADWLPGLIGDAADAESAAILDPADGSITNEFSTAAFRFGHTMVPTDLPRLNEDGSSIGDLTVRDQFFNIQPILEQGIDHLLRGHASEAAQAMDTQVIDDLNFFLVLGNGSTGFSLPALNIMRGRDHGLASWLDTRAALVGDIDPDAIDLTDFSLLTSDADAAARLVSVYGTLDKVDLWVGGLAEDKLPGAQAGPTFTAILADQFARTRSADDTFGDLDAALDPAIREEIANTSLTDIILRNSNIDTMQQDAFAAMARIGGTDGADRLLGSRDADLVTGGLGDDRLFGRRGDDEMYGGEGDDRLAGGRGNDRVIGGDGDDNLRGQSGDDVVEGGAGDDAICDHSGNNILDGGDGNDMIRGGRDADTILGGAGNDRLRGKGGDDIIDMGSGNDRAVGDGGADTFIFAEGYGRDQIMDFEAGIDTVDLTGTSVADFTELSALASEGRNRVTFDLGDDTLILRKVALDDLDAEDFLFG